MITEPFQVVSAERAVEWLPPGDQVHCRLGTYGGAVMVGAWHEKDELIAFMHQAGRIDIAGPYARAQGYGLAILMDGGGSCLFIRADVPESAIRFNSRVPAELN